MNFTVINHDIHVGNIKTTVVSGASVFIIGDSQIITPSSIFDTPPESVSIGIFVPTTSGR